jgi:hypothetical protein
VYFYQLLVDDKYHLVLQFTMNKNNTCKRAFKTAWFNKAAKKAKRETKRAKMREAGADDDLEVLVTDYMGRKKARIDKRLEAGL